MPFFSLIVVHDGIGSILTEDITQGGKLKIYKDDIASVLMQPKPGKGGRVRVYTDFKHAHRIQTDDLGRQPLEDFESYVQRLRDSTARGYSCKYHTEEAVLVV